METRKYYKGTPRNLVKGNVFAMSFASVLKSGRFMFGLQISDTEFRRKHDCQQEMYYQDIPLNYKMPDADICEMLMVMVIDKDSDKKFRGQVVECPTENGEVHVLNVDTGDVSKCSVKNLFYISKEYLQEPFDSVLCHLDGLEFYENSENIKKACEDIVDLTPGQTVLGFCTGYSGDLPVFQIQDGTVSALHIRMLDSIIKEIRGRLPKLEEEKVASICHVEVDGQVFIHMDDSFIFELEKIIYGLKPDELLKGEMRDRGIESDKVYLAEDAGELYRCIVIDKITSPEGSDNKVRVVFIDYGNKAVVPENSLKCAGDINIALQKIPPLTHKVCMRGVSEIINMENFLANVMGKMFIVKAEGENANLVPCVSFWMKDERGNNLSLNETMIKAGFAKKD